MCEELFHFLGSADYPQVCDSLCEEKGPAEFASAAANKAKIIFDGKARKGFSAVSKRSVS